jgi:hypothetical protein
MLIDANGYYLNIYVNHKLSSVIRRACTLFLVPCTFYPVPSYCPACHPMVHKLVRFAISAKF